MRPKRQRGHKRMGRQKQIKPTRLRTMTGESNDPQFTRKLIVAGQHTPERACDGKARFAQYEHAVKADADLRARHHDNQRHEVYPCPFCGGFHLAKIAGRRA